MDIHENLVDFNNGILKLKPGKSMQSRIWESTTTEFALLCPDEVVIEIKSHIGWSLQSVIEQHDIMVGYIQTHYKTLGTGVKLFFDKFDSI